MTPAVAATAIYLGTGAVFTGSLHVWLLRTQGEGRGLHWFAGAVFAVGWPIVLGWMAWRLRVLIREHQPAGRGGSHDSTRDDSPRPRWPIPRSESPGEWN